MFVHESALNLQSDGDRSVGARLAPDCVDKRERIHFIMIAMMGASEEAHIKLTSADIEWKCAINSDVLSHIQRLMFIAASLNV